MFTREEVGNVEKLWPLTPALTRGRRGPCVPRGALRNLSSVHIGPTGSGCRNLQSAFSSMRKQNKSVKSYFNVKWYTDVNLSYVQFSSSAEGDSVGHQMLFRNDMKRLFEGDCAFVHAVIYRILSFKQLRELKEHCLCFYWIHIPFTSKTHNKTYILYDISLFVLCEFLRSPKTTKLIPKTKLKV